MLETEAGILVFNTDFGSVTPPAASISGQPDSPSPRPSDVASSSLVSLPSAPVSVTPKKRRPWRVKAPKDSRVYKAVIAVVAMRAQGINAEDISVQLGLTKETIRTYLKRAHARGWLNIGSFDDPEDQLEVVLKSKSVRNINIALDERNLDGGLTEYAKDVAIEVAKGTGLLKTHQVVKGDAPAVIGFALKVQVDLPQVPVGQSLPAVREGSLGGTPALVGELVEEGE